MKKRKGELTGLPGRKWRMRGGALALVLLAALLAGAMIGFRLCQKRRPVADAGGREESGGRTEEKEERPQKCGRGYIKIG